MVISINDFFNTLIKTPDLPGVFNICFLIPNNASFFYEQLLFFCKRYIKNISVIENIEIEQNIPRLLSTTFLGDRCFYWSFSQELPTIINNFLSNYNGPNCLFRIISNLSRKPYTGEIIVKVPNFVDIKSYNTLYSYFFENNLNKRKNLFEQILFENSSKYNLDQAILFMRYQAILQNETSIIQEQFFKSWYNLNIENYNFMFQLSDLLFNLDYNRFFLKWYEFKNSNPIEYWITFWANQIFKAACFVKLANIDHFEHAKKTITGLPFSFLNRNWKKFNFEKLLNAHSSLYELDQLAKFNITEFEGLELWYNKFLLN